MNLESATGTGTTSALSGGCDSPVCHQPRRVAARETVENHRQGCRHSCDLPSPSTTAMIGKSKGEDIRPQPSKQRPRGTQIAVPSPASFGVNDFHTLVAITVRESGSACVRIDAHPQTS